MFRRFLFHVLILLLVISAFGCKAADVAKNSPNIAVEQKGANPESALQTDAFKFSEAKSKKCEVISCVKTVQKDTALTFDGMGDESTIRAILDELDKYGIKSVFFLPGMRVAEEPEIAQEILRRGHTIGNNTLNKVDLTTLDYENIYKEIKLSHDIIVEKTGAVPKYLRTRSGNYNDNVQYAAAQCGYEAIITYSINPQDWDMKSAGEIADIVEERLSKGSVIMLNTDKNIEVVKAIPLIAKIAENAGYYLVSMEQLFNDRLPEVDVVKAGSGRTEVISYVYTTKPRLALTFDGMGDKKTMQAIFDELDKYKIKSTFFLPGERVAENPEIAQEILKRGHNIQNNAFNKADLTSLSYDEIYKQIKLSHDIILKMTGVSTKYLRPGQGKFNDDVLAAASKCGFEGVVTYNIYPQNWDLNNAGAASIISQISRGRIIMLNADNNTDVARDISMTVKMVAEAGLKLVALEVLLEGQYERLPDGKAPGYHVAKITADYENAEYRKIVTGSEDKKQVAITFDDWANDFYLSKLLGVLRKHNVSSTFFLRANGVERVPNLARLILEEGHEIANHTYSHAVVTGLSPAELQKEVVKCHQVLTNALGQSPKLYFRPPTGAIDDQSAKAIAASGYKTIVMYNISSYDWKPEVTVDDIVKDVVESTVPGSIVLLHLQDNMKTALALDIIIEQLKDNGYKLVTITELMD